MNGMYLRYSSFALPSDDTGSPVSVSVEAVLTAEDPECSVTVPVIGAGDGGNIQSNIRSAWCSCRLAFRNWCWVLHNGQRCRCRYRRRRCARLGWSIYSPLSPTTIAASIIIHRDSVSIWESVIVISEHRWSPNHRHRKQQPSGYDEPYPDTSLLCRSVRGGSLTSIPITQSFLSLLGTESVHPPSMLPEL